MDDVISFIMRQMKGTAIINRGLRGGVGLGPELSAKIKPCFLTPSRMDVYQSRVYRPGDELKHVDWRSYARTDKLHVTESLTEEKIAFYIFVDQEVLDTQLLEGHEFEYIKLVLYLCFIAFSKGGKVFLFSIKKQNGNLMVGRAASGANLGKFLQPMVDFFKSAKDKPSSIPFSSLFSRIAENRPYLFFIGLFFHRQFLPTIREAGKRWMTSVFFPEGIRYSRDEELLFKTESSADVETFFCSSDAQRLLFIETFRYFREVSKDLQRAGIPVGVVPYWKRSYDALVGFFEQYKKRFSNN